MSSSEEWAWERAARRREIYLERVADTTRSFLDRYQQVISDMRAEGLDEYVSEEFARARNLLEEAYECLGSDAERARELSRSVGSLVGGLPRYARDLKREEETRRRNEEMARHAAEERARVIKEREKADLISRLQIIAGEIISDPVANDLAYSRIQNAIGETERAAADASITAQSLEAKFRQICQKLKPAAEKEAEAWRAEHRRAAVVEDVREDVDLRLKAIEEERRNKSTAANAELSALTEKLMALKRQLAAGSVTAASAGTELEAVQRKSDEVHCSEELRRDTLRAINRQMKALGFTSSPPALQDQWVRLAFARADGAQAVFLVDTEGTMKFKFDGYRGKACKKDRDAVMEKMRSAYGITFSTQRVIWENPDEIGKDAVDAKRPDSFNGGF